MGQIWPKSQVQKVHTHTIRNKKITFYTRCISNNLTSVSYHMGGSILRRYITPHM
uniref:Uncharacterized protein n=1 Tax=Ciona intestinalis TaxID=7719 RepID=H2XMX7_CIOIN